MPDSVMGGSAAKPTPMQVAARIGILICAAVSLTAAARCELWLAESGPIIVEDTAADSQRILNPRVHAGDFVYTHRSVRVVESCPVEIGVWIADASGQPIYPRGEYRSYISASDAYKVTPIGYEIPAKLPAGHYKIENYVACQVNPLTLITVRLQGLPFEVVAPDVPL